MDVEDVSHVVREGREEMVSVRLDHLGVWEVDQL